LPEPGFGLSGGGLKGKQQVEQSPKNREGEDEDDPGQFVRRLVLAVENIQGHAQTDDGQYGGDQLKALAGENHQDNQQRNLQQYQD